MTIPPAPGTPRRRRTSVASVVLGVALVLVADSVVLGGVPALRSAWEGTPATPDRVAPTKTTPSRSPAPSRSRTPSASASPTKASTSGQVDVTAEISRGIVLIDGELGGTTTSSGTGMVLTDTGQVLTNYHVVRSTRTLTVRLASTQRRYTATVIGRDAAHDVALLQLSDATGLETITPDTDPIAVGDSVTAAGNAGGQGYLTAYGGHIVATDRSIRVRGGSTPDPVENLTGLLESDAKAVPGDSGGPLYDSQLQVSGMTTAGNAGKSGNTGTAFAVPIANALRIVDQIRAGDDSGTIVIGAKASIGIMATDGSDGVTISSIVAGSAASKAGMRAGDVLNALDDYSVDKVAALVTTLDNFRPGQSVRIRWQRNGESKSATVTLDASQYN